MSVSKSGVPSFEQAWSVLSDIAKACREFNTLQFQYRQLALSLILAAYAAMGYFIVNEFPAKNGGTIEASEAVGRAAPAASSTAPAPAAATTPTASRQNFSAEQTESPAIRSHRVSLLLLGIGLLSSFATLSIWLIDVRVYHRLLIATFDAGKDFEADLKERSRETWPPLLGIRMAQYIPGRAVVAWMCGFYALGVFAGPMPWAIHNWVSSRITARDIWERGDVAAGVMIIAAVAVTFVAWSLAGSGRKRKSESESVLRLPTGEATVAGPIDSAARIAQELFRAAAAARNKAYAPYSKFRVGAAVLVSDGSEARVFSGCNVENAAGGETLCAERNAIATAIAAGFREIREILVYGDERRPTPPCGACRGVLHEFNPLVSVHLADEAGVRKTFGLSELYPHPFGPESLGRR